ncbi:rab guanine nucleotide exchange factor S2 [Exophiala dermatitidis]|uniref:Rab guanine nucleotide exchange factor S2 n=1 Tax=Exophiala dermatitidis TaxID=5970 RepID=A0AAN6IY05_EXODE|nr:rab guanine nucleotide exchange factor S2 [Exophiala dermatitidis]KAJ4527433.1 rab guanine nucleotide exchange factor S2 [Exophiala dermatitidis]KAJ4530998.1 rab guanine nucleotide exchange factor S2 [Exophiala dermatitidis]KAJ4558166.1 rab guanine nucleotide exchange factor S2 [Exophiala dermatitidis]KAJ4581802.1 rab guanine nucleotide exchange factor S2 [Exophiala dermatitidis]
MHAWVHHGSLLGAGAPSHSRSISLGPPLAQSQRDHLSKAKSTSNLHKMATIEASPPPPRQNQDGSPETSFRTIADPRNASTTDLSRSDSSSSRHPDLNSEVAALSDKLISAINHQTNLDDTLARTRQELEASRARIAELEAEARAYEERLARGDLVPRESVEEQNNKLRSELEEERRQKAQIQQEKRGIESELETLTASLFDEANKMVASANRDRDATEKKNQQLRDQIKDGEAVIASQTEQLAELKELMQQIGPSSDYRKELDSPRVSLAPSSPGAAREEHNIARLLEAMHLSPVDPDHGEITPSPSSQLTHLLRTICRTDIPAYEDFRNLVQTSHFRSHNPSHAPSRAGSGSYGGLNMMGLGSLSNNSNTNLSQAAQPATSKLANSPNLPGSFSPNPDSRGPVPLKDTRFYKRILVEDIEPTLRLDLSPTLSWLNRRSILSALGDSTLIVEPIPEASLRLYGKYTPCALCGESRKEGENPRTHAMRVREGEGATKWSICTLCLEKVRGVGDLVAYVRMVREGVVKVGDRKDEEDAWEELIRLRERLFWARMAGGVVPAFLPTPTKSTPVENGKMDDEVAGVGGADAKMGKVNSPSDPDNNNTPSHSAADPSAQSAPDSPLAGIGTVSPDQAAQLQLQQGLDESLTTFDNIKEKRMSNPAGHRSSSTPPTTPPRQRHIKRQSSSGGGISFPRINIPRLPAGFWEAQVNTLT